MPTFTAFKAFLSSFFTSPKMVCGGKPFSAIYVIKLVTNTHIPFAESLSASEVTSFTSLLVEREVLTFHFSFPLKG